MKNVLIWFAAVFITVTASIYQRVTGPTYDKKVSFQLSEQIYDIRLPRSHGGETNCPVELEVSDSDISGKIYFRRYPTKDQWSEVEMIRDGDVLIAHLPNQPPAGKLEYHIELLSQDKMIKIGDNEKIIIRFKGSVPGGILIPHIFIMFFAMLLSNVAGIYALFNDTKYKLYGLLTLFGLLVGGMIFGPIMQWYAFGEAWTGVPFGWDLTDNKTLIAVLGWIVAVWINRKNEKPIYTIVASLILLVIYFIPHSLLGSELDYESGDVVTGFINLYL